MADEKVFYCISTKKLYVFHKQKTVVKYFRAYIIEKIDTIFLIDRKLYVYYINDKTIEHYELNIGFFATGDDDDEDLDETSEKYMEEKKKFLNWAFLFMVWLWRIFFLLTSKVLRCAKVKNLECVKLKEVNDTYYNEIFKKIMDTESSAIKLIMKKVIDESGKKPE